MISRKQRKKRGGEKQQGMMGSGRVGMEGESGTEGESEGSESDWELACCLLHAMKNKVSNQSACVCVRSAEKAIKQYQHRQS